MAHVLVMALTPSSMQPLGAPAPEFSLPDTLSGRALGPADFGPASGLLVMFLCNHCPYVKHVNPELVRLAHDYQPRGLAILAISSNDAAAYPEDGPGPMQAVGRALGYPFPYLYDESQAVARAYGATCTPDFFLYDAGRRLVYRGRLDPSTPGNGLAATGADLRGALDALLEGRPIPGDQKPSLGCSIKFRPAAATRSGA